MSTVSTVCRITYPESSEEFGELSISFPVSIAATSDEAEDLDAFTFGVGFSSQFAEDEESCRTGFLWLWSRG